MKLKTELQQNTKPERVPVYLEPELKKAVTKAAHGEGRTVSGLIRWLLMRYLEGNKE